MLSCTDLPAPVAPAMSRWGISARSLTSGRPSTSRPIAMGRAPVSSWKSDDSRISRRPTTEGDAFGTSIPTTPLPFTRSTRMAGARSAMQISSWRFRIFLRVSPSPNRNSNVVTTGPGWMRSTSPRTPCSRQAASRALRRSSSARFAGAG